MARPVRAGSTFALEPFQVHSTQATRDRVRFASVNGALDWLADRLSGGLLAVAGDIPAEIVRVTHAARLD